jgi:hypothetical protein
MFDNLILKQNISIITTLVHLFYNYIISFYDF